MKIWHLGAVFVIRQFTAFMPPGKKNPKKKKPANKTKRWQFIEQCPSEEEEEDKKDSHPGNDGTSGTDLQDVAQEGGATIQQTTDIVHQVDKDPEDSMALDGSGGSKRAHVSESSDSDKKAPHERQDLALILIEPNSDGWQKVQKQKGEREKLCTSQP